MRTRPYTTEGIKRVPCFRCGKPSKHQWQICADDRVFRAVCGDCDIALNELVLRWMGFKDWKQKMKLYKRNETRKNP